MELIPSVKGVGYIEVIDNPEGLMWGVFLPNSQLDSMYLTYEEADYRLGELCFAEALLSDDAWEPI